MSLDLAAIRAAHTRIRPHIHRTPVLTSTRLDGMVDRNLFFKCENFQKAGAFKSRGAINAVLSLSDVEAARGVATHSSGNHGAALARAARLRGIPAYIVMPSNTATVKIRAVEGYGGLITFCESSLRAREGACAEIVARTGAALIHPFTDERVMAGQGTAAIELLEECPDLDAVLCPVGGGGLLAGTAIAAKTIRPTIQVIATEPSGADDAARSFAAGTRVSVDHPTTIADGLRAGIGQPNFEIMRRHVDAVLTVADPAILAAMRLIWETMKIVIEPSAAVPFAALMACKTEFQGRRVGLLITGGNVDLEALT